MIMKLMEKDIVSKIVYKHELGKCVFSLKAKPSS